MKMGAFSVVLESEQIYTPSEEQNEPTEEMDFPTGFKTSTCIVYIYGE